MPRLADPYSTHLPVLEGIAKAMSLKRVLEYGAGDHSTPFFLSLPDLEWLVSVEDDPEWEQHVADKYDDPRLMLTSKPPKSTKGFDLIFIDNGTVPTQRVEAIQAVLSESHPIVVIHDAEVGAYHQAIEETGQKFTLFRQLKPYTAVVNPA